MADAVSYMAQHADRLVDNGWPIIPLRPGSKAPGKCVSGEWENYPDWTRHCLRLPTAFETSIWQRWPGCAVGIACGWAVGIDIDITDPALAHPFPAFQRGDIQILANGRQFVGFAIHPDTGKPYEWTEESPADVPIDDTPLVTEEQVRSFLDEAVALLPPEMQQSRLPEMRQSVGGRVESHRGPHGTVEGVKQALEWLRPTQIGAGSLYDWAMRYGWAPGPDVRLSPEPAPDEANPAQAYIDACRAKTAAEAVAMRKTQTTTEQQRALGAIDGVLGEMVLAITASAISPQPWLALGASLAAVGCLMGRRYRATRNARSNLYVICIADSGGGKDHARKWMKEAFFGAGLQSYLGGSSPASGQAILSSLRSHAARYYQIDEFGQFMRGVLGQKAPPHRLEIWSKLMELYSSADGWFQGTEYANQKERPREDICQPTCCIHATTVPGPFWASLESGSSSDGSLARWLIFQTDNHYPDRAATDGVISIPPSVIDTMQRIVKGAEGHDYGGDLAMMMGGDAAPTPYTVPMAPDTEGPMAALHSQQMDWLRQAATTGLNSIIARLEENAIKVALIKAVSRDPARPVITGADVEWAHLVVRHCTETMLAESRDRIADNQTEAHHKRLLRVIRTAGADGITAKQLARTAQWVKSRERGEILYSLMESGQVVKDEIRTGKAGRATTVYRAVDDGDGE